MFGICITGERGWQGGSLLRLSPRNFGGWNIYMITAWQKCTKYSTWIFVRNIWRQSKHLTWTSCKDARNLTKIEDDFRWNKKHSWPYLVNFLGGNKISRGWNLLSLGKGAFHVFCLWVGSFPGFFPFQHLWLLTSLPTSKCPPRWRMTAFVPPKNPKVQNIPNIPGNLHAKQFLGNEMMMWIRKKSWISPELRKFPQVCGDTFWFRTWHNHGWRSLISSLWSLHLSKPSIND